MPGGDTDRSINGGPIYLLDFRNIILTSLTVFGRINAPEAEAENEPLTLSDFNGSPSADT